MYWGVDMVTENYNFLPDEAKKIRIKVFLTYKMQLQNITQFDKNQKYYSAVFNGVNMGNGLCGTECQHGLYTAINIYLYPVFYWRAFSSAVYFYHLF